VTPLLELVLNEITTSGPLRFSRYMELALYHPQFGFYAAGGAGRRRDFITSPEVGPLFGAVVARAIDGWWRDLGRPSEFTFVEAGAGSGTLARAVLRCELECRDALRYVAVETSAAQRDRHPDGIHSLEAMPSRIDTGAVFANELLDNLPFDVLQFDATIGWQEVRVGARAGALVETLVPADGPDLVAGHEVELRVPVQQRAGRWVEETLASIGRGRLVVIDYAVSRYPVEADREWLRTYSGQERAGSPLQDPGSKDITCDVDIAALERSGGPATVRSQTTWLRRHHIDELVDQGRAHWEARVSAPDLLAIEMRSRLHEVDALLDPGGLGGFSVVEWLIGDPETTVTR
jgi:SAM-dependent MidA family methyltransferase